MLVDNFDFEVIGQVLLGEDVIECVCKDWLDIVLMDICMLGIGGFEVICCILCIDDFVWVIVVIVCVDDLYFIWVM